MTLGVRAAAPLMVLAHVAWAGAAVAASGDDQVGRFEHGGVVSGEQSEPRRWFAASTIDLGYKFVRPRLSVGHGRPFHSWVGIDVNALGAGDSVGGYAGLRLATAVVTIRSGLFYLVSFDRSLLPLQDSYTREESEIGQDSAKIPAASTEMTLDLELFGGKLLSETEAFGVFGVRRDRAMFLETLGVITDGSWVLRQRVGHARAVFQGLYVGAVVEALVLTGRDSIVWRAGPLARWRLYDSLGLRFTLLPVVASPDSLGIEGALFEFGLRYYWAP